MHSFLGCGDMLEGGQTFNLLSLPPTQKATAFSMKRNPLLFLWALRPHICVYKGRDIGIATRHCTVHPAAWVKLSAQGTVVRSFLGGFLVLTFATYPANLKSSTKVQKKKITAWNWCGTILKMQRRWMGSVYLQVIFFLCITCNKELVFPCKESIMQIQQEGGGKKLNIKLKTMCWKKGEQLIWVLASAQLV